VGRFEGWYGFGYNRLMRRRWLRSLVYWALGGAPALRHLDAFIDRVTDAHPADGVLLDVPCGEGLVERELQRRRWTGRVTALDLAARAVHRTGELATDFELKVVRGSALDLPFADASMASIVSINGLHVMPDPVRFLSELGRVVTADGSIWLTTIVSGPGMRRRVLIAVVRRLGVLPIAPPNAAALRRLIELAGLCIVEDLGGSTVVALRLMRRPR
jgi:ubiquinone/menaquinone biosynthesis C-methylase UbiE